MNMCRAQRFSILSASLFIFVCAAITPAQSNDQNSPTPVTSNEISSTIKARDIGDARVTTHFYIFDGDQGDIFINVVTKNFSGDIDVFTVDGLRPLTKMVIYADSGINETGRLIYLRKPERLLLRVEGRTPGDDTAVYRIKFGGSFIALAPRKTDETPDVPDAVRDDGIVRVNSVGTIIPTARKVTITELKIPTEQDTSKKISSRSDESSKTNKSSTPNSQPPAKQSPRLKDTNKGTVSKPTKKPDTQPSKAGDPLQNIRLVIALKSGTVIQYRMSNVLRFSVDNGELTVITKDGDISRYSILRVAKVTIE